MNAPNTVQETLQGKIDYLKPTIFIGLGGTGLETLKILKRLHYKFYPKDMPIFKYLSIDTRRNDEILEPLELDEQLALTDNQIVRNAGDILPNLENRFPDIYNWLPTVTKWRKFDDISKIQEGASQCRAIGRYLFNLASNDISEKIKKMINQVTNQESLGMLAKYGLTAQTGAGIEIFILASVCGGTGSGQFLDLAYLCRYAASKLPGVKIYATLAMPNLFADVTEGTERMNEANAYAALKELDHFMDKKEYSAKYSSLGIDYSNLPPFDIVYLIDSPNEHGITLSSRQEGCEMMANAIFAFTASKTRDAYKEYYDNDKAKLNLKTKNNLGTDYVTHYSTFGVASIKFPSFLIAKACAFRRSMEICQRIVNPLTMEKYELSEKKADTFISDLGLKPEVLKEYLHPTVRRPFETWYLNTKFKLAEEDEKNLKAGINNEKQHVEDVLTFNQNHIIDENKTSFLEKKVGGREITDRIESFVRQMANNYKSEGIDFALKTITDIRENLDIFISNIQKDETIYIDDIDRHKKSHLNFMKKLEELIKQGWFKNLFDFDKEEQLAAYSDSSILPLRDKGIKEVLKHRSERVLEIYRKVDTSLSELELDLQKTSTRIRLTLSELKIRYKDSKNIPLREGLQYHVLRQNGIDAIYDEISSGEEGKYAVDSDIDKINSDKPISDWSNRFNNEEELMDYLFNEITYPFFRKKIEEEVEGVRRFNIYTELKASKKYDDYIVSNLEAPSSPFISINTATLYKGGIDHIFEKDILGLFDKDKIDDALDRLISKKISVSTKDPNSVILVQTKHGFPLFSLNLINNYLGKCKSFRAINDNPCYTFNDDIISNFKDITPDSEEAVSVYHRAVHALDLGIMIGFLVKKPKGKVYYYCETKNDVQSGFPIKGGTGGGRRQTKEWLMQLENSDFLEKLEKKIESALLNMDKPTFEKFYQNWIIFKNQGIIKSQREREWKSDDLRNIPDYPVGCKDPKVIEEAKRFKIS